MWGEISRTAKWPGAASSKVDAEIPSFMLPQVPLINCEALDK